MAITATTVTELLQSIDTNVRNKTARNSITPDNHSDLLNEMVIVLSGGTDTYITGGTYTQSANTVTLTDNGGGSVDITGITSDGYQYTGITISSGEILTMQSSPIELLPPAGTNNYYQWHMDMEYTHGGIDYSWGMSYVDLSGVLVSAGIITSRGNARAEVNSIVRYSDNNNQIFVNSPQDGLEINQNLNMKGSSGPVSDPTNGNGTLLIKLWYKIKTIG